MAELLSVRQAAERLGVSAGRVHQRIADGSLPARRVGSRWAIDAADLRPVAYRRDPGRPLSSRSAWALLYVAANRGDQLDPVARSKARARLRSLTQHAGSSDLDNWLATVAKSLSARARREVYHAAVPDLADLREDARIRLSGASAESSNMAAGSLVEGYVDFADLPALVRDYLLVEGRRDGNVVLHIVEDPERAKDIEWLASCPLAIAADLAEHDSAREQDASARIAADLKRLWTDRD